MSAKIDRGLRRASALTELAACDLDDKHYEAEATEAHELAGRLTALAKAIVDKEWGT